MLTSPRRRHRCPPCGRTSVDAVIATSPCSTWNRHIRGQRNWRPGRPGRPGVTRGGRRHPHHRTGALFHVERGHTRRPPSSTWNTQGRSSCRRRAPGHPAALDSRQGTDRRLTLHGRSPTCHAERPARPRSVPRGTRALQHAMGVFGRIPTSSAFQQLSGSHGVRAPCFTWNGSDPPEFHVEPHPGAEAPARYPIEFSRAHRPGGPGERNPGPGLGPGHRWVGHHGRVRVVPRGTLDDPCDHLVRLFHVEHDRVGSRWVSGRWRERVKGTRRSVAPPARIGDIVSDGSTWNPGDHACGSVCGFPCRRPHTVCVRYVARRFVSPALPAAVVSEPSRLRMLRTRLDPSDRRFRSVGMHCRQRSHHTNGRRGR